MASFLIQGYAMTQEVRGTRLVPVREFQVVSLPSETYFQFRRDPSQPCYATPAPCAQQFADRIEGVLGLPNVLAVQYSQDVNAAGQLVDVMTTYYQTADGSISGSVESTLAKFGPNFTGQQVAAELAAGGDIISGGASATPAAPA